MRAGGLLGRFPQLFTRPRDRKAIKIRRRMMFDPGSSGPPEENSERSGAAIVRYGITVDDRRAESIFVSEDR
jgi:hypothetical protein